MTARHKQVPGSTTTAKPRRSTTVRLAVTDGLARIADIAPDQITVFTEDSDWAFLGGDFKAAIDSLIATDARFQPPLPFDEDEQLVEAK